MELIDRYLQAVGRYLPRGQRSDILSELRSSLMDTLEARYGGNYSDENVAQVIQEMGAPQKVAASYDVEGQYLIGPALFATFKLVLGIVLAAVVGGQLIALVVNLALGDRALWVPSELGVIVNSLPAAFGMVVFVFALLQRFGVRPEFGEKQEPFDPRKLPPLEQGETVKRGELIVSLVFETLVLALLAQFVLRGGIPGTSLFFENPVINQYFFWIALSMIVGIALDAWLLWQGRWTPAARIAKLGSQVFSLVVLAVLVQGHTTWLNERGLTGLISSVNQLVPLTPGSEQAFGMAATRMGLMVAFVVSVVDLLMHVLRPVFGLLHLGRQMAVSRMIK